MNIYDQISILYFVLLLFFLYRIYVKEKKWSVFFKFDKDNYFSEAERTREVKVRINWLISFFLIFTFSVISTLYPNADGLNLERVSNKFGVMFAIVASTLINAPWFLVTYHCSFKKRGTAWLVWIMICSSLVILIGFFQFVESNIIIDDSKTVNLFLATTIFAIEIYYLVSCFLLYKVNSFRKRKRRGIRSKNLAEKLKFLDYMTKMEDSSNLDELNLNFKEAVDQWPHQQERISKTYQKSKSALQEKNN